MLCHSTIINCIIILGTISQLLTVRPEDKSTAGFKSWTFTTVHFWGENPAGIWKLYIVDNVINMAQIKLRKYMPKVRIFQTSAPGTHVGKVGELKLTFYGTKKLPSNTIFGAQSRMADETRSLGSDAEVYDRLLQQEDALQSLDDLFSLSKNAF